MLGDGSLGGLLPHRRAFRKGLSNLVRERGGNLQWRPTVSEGIEGPSWISRKQFIEEYCLTSDMSWQELSKTRVVLPCNCREDGCRGWAMIRGTSYICGICKEPRTLEELAWAKEADRKYVWVDKECFYG